MEAVQLKRRLTAILMADVVDYSRLMGADEESTHARFGAQIRDVIDPALAQHGGRPVRSMGDGLLVEFDSAIAAVRCAIAIQSAIAEREKTVANKDRIRLRIGINTGDVIVDERDIYGNSVNVAARLESVAGPGEIYVTQGVYEQLRGHPDLSFTDRGEHQLKNIDHRVRAYRVEDSAAIEAVSSADHVAAYLRLLCRGLLRRPRSAIGLTFSLLIIAGLLIAAVPNWRYSALLPRSSILVLPFRNLTNDPAQDYFADAVTNDLTTDLSRLRGLLVISPGTAFTFKGKQIDPRQVGEDIGVRYLLDGGIRHVEGRVNTSVRLIEASTGAQLWADRFASEFAEIGKLEDAITGRIASSLNFQLIKAESRRAEQVVQPDALDLRLRAEGAFFRAVTPDNTLAARRLLQEAVRLDPNSAESWARLAQITASDYLNRWNNTGPDQLAAADSAVHKALNIDPDLALAHLANGFIHKARGEHQAALGAFSRAIELDPNFALAYAHKGNTLIFVGRPGDAQPLVEQAIRLSPRDPSIGIFLWISGRAQFYAGGYDKAIPWLRKSVEVRPNIWYNRLYLVSAYALVGEIDEAKKLLTEFNRRFANPVYTIATVKAQESTDPSTEPLVVAARDRFHQGLLLAGMATQ